MATKTIAWESGIGYITLTYTGVGNAPISVKSDANESFNERQQTVRIATTSGSPSRAVNLLIKQKGKTYPAGTVFNFDYTGTVQEITLPPGRYKLQCWGAQGGNSDSYSGIGSKGGYSEGQLTLTEPTTLYIFVGGKGASSGNGGWNGGGGSTGISSYDSGGTYGKSYPACGGGATDIATVTSDMSYSSKRNNRSAASLLSRCIVAGGGAGGSAHYTKEETTGTQEISQGVFSDNFRRYYSEQLNYTEFAFSAPSMESGETYVLRGAASGATINSIVAFFGSNYSFVNPGTTFTAQSGFTYWSVRFNGNVTTLPSLYFTLYKVTTSTSTDTYSGSSNASQQGGGTSGRGTSPGTQNGGGGEFGKGNNQDITNYRYASGAGGGGWYGGGSTYSDSSTSYINSSGGGSGFVNTAANIGYRPSGYTGFQLDSGETKAGNVSFPSPNGGNETGHSGNGYARITVL